MGWGKGCTPTSSYTYIIGREYIVPSISVKAVPNSSNDKLALPITLLIHLLTLPTNLS